MLWHRRLGHFHHTALLFMKKNDLGEGLLELEVKPSTCVACIEHQLTTPYTPQQNGVVERKNRTLMEMTRLPTKALQQKTPFEAWYGYKPRLQNFKTFGCLCFSYIPHVKRDKLDKKAEAGIFIGNQITLYIYRRCNVAIIEPVGYEEVAVDKKMDGCNERGA
ncbi:Retrovirus-related Pol polyprotein from transposon RE2 [Vitis vinifera]|uniref:Retrovirus-related Pol polyprotein from transposon RE2 n=1 Tax=Vitis vinifera TaxID=29760 RepID=A0A438CXW3_VITVI|nr:Retrovirus-related Pol polyprotein from transposon RE2 [Vitis vinifera]